MRVKEIGAQLYLDSGTLTPLLKRLEGLGLVRRVRDVEDERQVTILLTAAGQALEQRAVGIPHEMDCIAQLNGENAAALIETVTKLRANLQNAPDVALAPV